MLALRVQRRIHLRQKLIRGRGWLNVGTVVVEVLDRVELERLKSNCRDYALRKFSEKNAEIIIRSYQN